MHRRATTAVATQCDGQSPAAYFGLCEGAGLNVRTSKGKSLVCEEAPSSRRGVTFGKQPVEQPLIANQGAALAAVAPAGSEGQRREAVSDRQKRLLVPRPSFGGVR